MMIKAYRRAGVKDNVKHLHLVAVHTHALTVARVRPSPLCTCRQMIMLDATRCVCRRCHQFKLALRLNDVLLDGVVNHVRAALRVHEAAVRRCGVDRGGVCVTLGPW